MTNRIIEMQDLLTLTIATNNTWLSVLNSFVTLIPTLMSEPTVVLPLVVQKSVPDFDRLKRLLLAGLAAPNSRWTLSDFLA